MSREQSLGHPHPEGILQAPKTVPTAGSMSMLPKPSKVLGMLLVATLLPDGKTQILLHVL